MAIAVIGPVTKDVIIMPNKSYKKVGGTAYYTSYALRKLKVNTAVFAKLSQKDGDLLKAFQCRVFPSWSRHTTAFRNEYKNMDRRDQFVDSVSEPFSLKDIKNAKNFDVVHVGPLTNTDFSSGILEWLSENNKMLSLDVQGYVRSINGKKVVNKQWKEHKEFLPFVDILKCDVEEASHIVRKSSLRRMAEKISILGPREVIITHGSQGSYVYSEGNFMRVEPITPTKMLDVTGAGDTYMAGYLAKRLKTQDIRECGLFASLVASKRISGSL